MNYKKSKELTRLDRFWLSVGLLLFRVEGAPIEYRVAGSTKETPKEDESSD